MQARAANGPPWPGWPALSEAAQKQVLELDAHGGAGVDLQAEPAAGQVFWIAVIQLAHRYAVDGQSGLAAFDPDGVVVPVVGLDHFQQPGGRAEFARDALGAVGLDEHLLTALGQDFPQRVFHDDAGPAAGGVEVGLGADQGLALGLAGGALARAIIDAGIAALEFEFQAQLEVLDLVLPDKEVVLGDPDGLGSVAGNGAVLDGPEARVAVPTGQVVAVEQVHKTRRQAGGWLGAGDVPGRAVVARRGGGIQVSHRKLDGVGVELEHACVPEQLGAVAERGVEDAALTEGLDPGEGEVVVFAVDPFDPHVGAAWVEREEHAHLAPVIGGAVFVDFVRQPEILAAEGGHEGMGRFFHRDADLFVPGMAGELGPAEFLELRPVGVGGDRVMQKDHSATATNELQQAAPQHRLHLHRRGPVLLKGRLGQVCRGGGNPRAGAVVHDDGIELAQVLGQIERQVAADHRHKRAGLLADSLERGAAIGDAVTFVGVLLHQVGRRIPDQHPARLFGRHAGFGWGGVVDLPGPLGRDFIGGEGRSAHKREGESEGEGLAETQQQS